MGNKIPRVNEADEIIGETTIAVAKENGWPRRISRVFLFDSKGNILLQRRGPTVHSYPNRLDQTAGGHVDLGETYEEAAYRELKEETGVEEVVLNEVVVSYRNRDCFESGYTGFISKDTELKPDSREVSEMIWMSVAEFEDKLKNDPDDCIDVLDRFWFEHRDKLIDNK